MIPRTLILDPDTWDLEISPTGNLEATATLPEYAAQTVANEWRLFRDDAYFFRTEGQPYFESTLGLRPPAALVTAYLLESAYSVYGVQLAAINDFKFAQRLMSATGSITTTDGSEINVVF